MKVLIIIAAICITKALGKAKASEGWGQTQPVAYVIPQQVQGGWGWNTPHQASLLQHHHQYQYVQQPQLIKVLVGASSGWDSTPQVVRYSQPENAIGGWRGGFSLYGSAYAHGPTYSAGWGGVVQPTPVVSYQIVRTKADYGSGGWRR